MTNSRGLSVIEVLVAAAIFGITIGLMSTVVTRQARETQSLKESLAVLDIQRSLLTAMGDGSVCRYMMNYPTQKKFDSRNLPQTIDFTTPLYASVTPGSPPQPGPPLFAINSTPSAISTTVRISSIQLVIKSGGNGSYLADWRVGFDSSRLAKPLKPATVTTSLYVDDTTDPAQATVAGCNHDSSLSPCAYGSYESGATNVDVSAGANPTFAEAFVTKYVNNNDWGIGCQPNWRLLGCNGGQPGGGPHVPLVIRMYNGAPICNAISSWGLKLVATCCKM